MNMITTIRATESMKDNLAREIQELTRDTRGSEVEATLVKEVSRQREAILAIARTVEKITKSPNVQNQITIGLVQMAKNSVALKIRKNRDRAHSAEGERGVHDAAFGCCFY